MSGPTSATPNHVNSLTLAEPRRSPIDAVSTSTRALIATNSPLTIIHTPERPGQAERHPEGDEPPPEDAADVGGLAHRPVAAAVLRPAHGADDPTAVERCSGEDVERRQSDVDGGEPGNRGDEQVAGR